MKAGLLDRRLTLQRAAVLVNDYGEEIPTWLDVATVWASKEDVRDAERVAAAQVGATISTRFQIRWTADLALIGPADQAVCEGRVYGITAVKEIGRREGLELSCVAAVS